MKQLPRSLTLALVLGLLAVTVPASAEHGGIHPTFRQEQTYFHCTGSTKVSQVSWLEGTLGGGTGATGWNASPPAQSAQDGAGCGGLDWGGTTNPVYDPSFEGTFTGNVRDVTVRIYDLVLNQTRSNATEALRLNAWIDGVPIFPAGPQPNNGRTVTVTPVERNTGATDYYEFSITNIGYAIDIFDEEGQLVDIETGGAALEDGNGTQEHVFTLYLGLHGTAFGQDANGHKVNAWVWDTTEVPSGITFNPTTLSSAKVAADLPDFSGA